MISSLHAPGVLATCWVSTALYLLKGSCNEKSLTKKGKGNNATFDVHFIRVALKIPEKMKVFRFSWSFSYWKAVASQKALYYQGVYASFSYKEGRTRGFICHVCSLFACLPSSIWWLYVKNIHSLRRFSTLVRIGGAGYRVLAKLSHTRSRHFERVLAMYTKPRGHNDYPLELWLGRVSFRFLIFEVHYLLPSLLKETKPSDFKVAPDELFPTKRVRDFLEWSLLRNWMKDWLRYVHWYWRLECREFTGCFLKWLLFRISLWEIMEDQTRIEWAHSLWSSLEDLWFGSREGCSLEPAMSSRTPPWISGREESLAWIS